MTHADVLQSRRPTPAGDFPVTEAEATVLVLGAQEFNLVRGEVHDDETPARRQYPRRLDNRRRGVGKEVKHVVHGDQIDGAVGERHVVDVGLAHPAVAQLAALEIDPRHGQHLRARVDAGAAPDPRGEHLEDAPGAGPEIEHLSDWTGAGGAQHRLLDTSLVDEQRAGSIPLGGDASKIAARGARFRFAHHAEPRLVSLQLAVVARHEIDQRPRHLRHAGLRGQTVEHPCAFLMPLDQPGVVEQLEMAADAGLALIKHLGQLGDGQLGAGQQHQNAQASRLTRRAHRLQHEAHAPTRHPVRRRHHFRRSGDLGSSIRLINI